VFIVKIKVNRKLIPDIEIFDVNTGKGQSAQGYILNNQVSAPVFLRMVDIGSSQVRPFPFLFTEFNIRVKNILAGAFDLDGGFTAFE
jgi:hypothetical protein